MIVDLMGYLLFTKAADDISVRRIARSIEGIASGHRQDGMVGRYNHCFAVFMDDSRAIHLC
jgi:hypothetical protein